MGIVNINMIYYIKILLRTIVFVGHYSGVSI